MQSLKTKIFTCLLSFVMAFSLIPAINSNAAVSTLKTGTCGANGNNLTYVLDANYTLTIKGTGAMKNFTLNSTSTDIPWAQYQYSIKKIVIENGVSSIGDLAFVDCTSLTEIVWPTDGSLKTIGKGSFYECQSLPAISLPKGLVSVGYEAFMKCSGATSLSLPGTLKTISYGAFAYCWRLTKVSIPNSVVTIGDFAFSSDNNLTSVTGGAGLKTIGRQAFEFCYSLKTFNISSKKLSKIGPCCFRACYKLKTISIKKTTKLKKKGVRGSLSRSYVKTVKVKKSKVRKYKKIFKRSNSGRSVKVKK